MINSPLYINYQTIFTKVHIFHSLKSCNQIPLTPILESPNLANWFTTQKQIRNNKLAVDRSSFWDKHFNGRKLWWQIHRNFF